MEADSPSIVALSRPSGLSMNSNALTSWIQVVTGIAALIVAILTGRPALKGIQAADAAAPLSGLGAAQSWLIVFAVMSVIALGLIFAIVGISALLAAAFRSHGATAPIRAAYFITLAGILAAGAATCAIFTSPAWLLLASIALMSGALALVPQADRRNEGVLTLLSWGAIAMFVIFLWPYTGLTEWAARSAAERRNIFSSRTHDATALEAGATEATSDTRAANSTVVN